VSINQITPPCPRPSTTVRAAAPSPKSPFRAIHCRDLLCSHCSQAAASVALQPCRRCHRAQSSIPQRCSRQSPPVDAFAASSFLPLPRAHLRWPKHRRFLNHRAICCLTPSHLLCRAQTRICSATLFRRPRRPQIPNLLPAQSPLPSRAAIDLRCHLAAAFSLASVHTPLQLQP
jgi:hypothetical protein